jgi:drug/metabolite transporter superfamily protein YnfA
VSWSAGLIALGLLLKIALSPVDESLGTWAGGAAAFGGVVIVPSVIWLRSRHREASEGHDISGSGEDDVNREN